MTEKRARKSLGKQYRRQNRHASENYDRVPVTFPAKIRERIKNVQGDSLSSVALLVWELLCDLIHP